MRLGEADAVATMFRKLPRDLGLDASPKISGTALRENTDVLHVTVAEDSGLLLGACSWLITFSSWRATKGMYVCDLYVMEHKRGGGIGERLLRAAGREAAKLGAKFMRLEASRENPKPGTFYLRNKFHFSDDDRVMFLEPEDFEPFIGGNHT